jgi:hypothetical protein
MSSSLVVVGYLYVVGISAYPRKAHAVVPVDPDGVLALSVASQLLKPVARRSPKILYVRGCVKHQELRQGSLSQFSRNCLRFAAPKEPLRFLVGEALYHIRILARLINSVKH